MSVKSGGRKRIDEGKVKRRKLAGLISLLVGMPNFILAVATTFGGIAVTIILGVVAFGLMNDRGDGGGIESLCIVFVLILVIVGLVLAILFTIISFIFAVGIGGQTIGGWYAIKGKHYGRSVTLILIGSIVSIFAGIGLIGLGALGKMDDWLRIVLILLGGYDVLAFLLTLVSFVMLLGTKETFEKPVKKEKKKKKGAKKK